MSESFLGFGLKILAIKISPIDILAPVQSETGGIEAGTEPEINAGRPLILLEQLSHGERAGGFVAVDAGGEVDAWSVERGAWSWIRDA